MSSNKKAYISKFEIEGEEQVRKNIGNGVYGAEGCSFAVDWLKSKSAKREASAKEANLLNMRQIEVAETANQLSERQTQAAESANRLARDANRLSKWAILLSIVGCILAVIAILYDRA